MALSHKDNFNYTDFAIIQNPSGVTSINSKAGTSVTFMIGGDVKTRLLSNGNFKIGGTDDDSDSGKKLTVGGDISASGDLILQGFDGTKYYFGISSGSLQLSGSASSSLKVNTAVSGGLFITASGFSDAFGGVHISGSVFHTGSTFNIGSENPPDGVSALNVSGSISASGHIYLPVNKVIYPNSPTLTQKIGYVSGQGGGLFTTSNS